MVQEAQGKATAAQEQIGILQQQANAAGKLEAELQVRTCSLAIDC